MTAKRTSQTNRTQARDPKQTPKNDTHDGGSLMGNPESRSHVVVAFRNRISNRKVSDGLPQAADAVGEAKEVTTAHRPDLPGGEVLLW